MHLAIGANQSGFNKFGVSCKAAIGNTVDLCLDTVTTLGERGSDGQPLALKVMGALSKIFQDQNVSHTLAQGCVKFTKYAGAPLGVINTITAPLVGFEDVTKDVKDCKEAIFNNKGTQKVNAELAVEGGETFKFEHKKKLTANNLVKFEKGLQVTVTLSGWLSDLASAIAKVAEMNFLELNETFLSHAARVGSLCATSFAYVGATGTLIKFGLASSRFWQAKNLDPSSDEYKTAKMAFKHASLGLVKTAMRITLLIYTAQISLTTQGIAALSMVAMDVYTKKTKKETLDTMKVSLLPVAAA